LNPQALLLLLKIPAFRNFLIANLGIAGGGVLASKLFPDQKLFTGLPTLPDAKYENSFKMVLEAAPFKPGKTGKAYGPIRTIIPSSREFSSNEVSPEYLADPTARFTHKYRLGGFDA